MDHGLQTVLLPGADGHRCFEFHQRPAKDGAGSISQVHLLGSIQDRARDLTDQDDCQYVVQELDQFVNDDRDARDR